MDNLKGNAVSSAPQVLDSKGCVQFLQALNAGFKRGTKEQFKAFTERNPWIVENLLPTGENRVVVVPRGTSTVECKLTERGLVSLLDGFGNFRSFEGIPSEKGVEAWGVAVQARHRTLCLDLDTNVFGNLPAKSELPEDFINWIYRHRGKAMFIRGNRRRMSVLLEMDAELSAELDSWKAHRNSKKKRIKNSVNGYIELSYGIANNTIFGKHPESGHYQQIFPKGKLGKVSKASFLELLGFLDEHCYTNGSDDGYSAYDGRVALEDVPEVTYSLVSLMGLRRRTLTSMGVSGDDINMKLSVRQFLNALSCRIMKGEVAFTSEDHFETQNGVIPKGCRHSTCLNFGSDINQIVEIFELAGISE